METVALLFLVPRSDVTQSRRCTSEMNEHTYGWWRENLQEFTVEQNIYCGQGKDEADKHVREWSIGLAIGKEGISTNVS